MRRYRLAGSLDPFASVLDDFVDGSQDVVDDFVTTNRSEVPSGMFKVGFTESPGTMSLRQILK